MGIGLSASEVKTDRLPGNIVCYRVSVSQFCLSLMLGITHCQSWKTYFRINASGVPHLLVFGTEDSLTALIRVLWFARTSFAGWDNKSYGYHGDDGNSFCCSGHGQAYGPTFTTADVIGCCVNLIDHTCFFTKNGVNLGELILTGFKADIDIGCLLLAYKQQYFNDHFPS